MRTVEKKAYIFTWSEILDSGGHWERYGQFVCDDDPKSIIESIINYGLDEWEIESDDFNIFEVSKHFTGPQMLTMYRSMPSCSKSKTSEVS